MLAVTEKERVVFTEISPGLVLGRAVAVLSQTGGRGAQMLSQQQAQISPHWVKTERHKVSISLRSLMLLLSHWAENVHRIIISS